MKQKLHLFSLLLLAVGLLAPAKAMAQVVIGNFTYTFSGNEATVTASSLTSGDIVIPETVVYGGNTYNVTALSYDNTLVKDKPSSPPVMLLIELPVIEVGEPLKSVLSYDRAVTL